MRLYTLIVHRPTYREVIQALPIIPAQADQRVYVVVEVAPDTRTAQAFGFGPVVGANSFSITLDEARSNAVAGLMVDLDSLTVPLGNGCTWYMKTSLLIVPTITNAVGRASVPIPIPNNAALQGLEVYFQFLVADKPYGAYQGLLSFSDATHVVIGK